ncbi:hypothetical protein [Vagococcus intermedius]|uniref:Phosphotransferase system EIIB component type 2/3 domain-containing protein n=1 Tax=Vagococcus intermedius TaxID=2991418 RepID=A0AAF0CV91_9ENTE|nr:hypothetical protein [Vagococcus intermedius]WEG73482.1 hypothetical protein OL234_00820 [Vagococcus intermedius]WEG75566.1 hypothetical protein OL235_00830 [Vagococcus intermedius]
MTDTKLDVISETEEKANVVLIFDLVFSFISDKGLLHTQLLAKKLGNILEKQGRVMEVESYSSDQLEQQASRGCVILLTPTYAYAQADIAEKFPTIPVIALSSQEYGLLDVETLAQRINEVLS